MIDALDILSGYDLKSVDSATRKHLVVEAMQRAYRDRAVYLGDPGFRHHADRAAHEQGLCGRPAHAAFARTKPCRAISCPASRARPSARTPRTFRCSTPQGNLVAATITINLFFGSGDMVPKTGVLLNDEMDDFSIKPGTPNAFGLVGNAENAIAPNKRPLSSMTPSFIETPRGLMVIGSPGGSYIISMVILGTLDYLDGMSAEEIVSDPRYHHQYLPDVVEYEKGAFTRERDRASSGHGPQARGGQPPLGQHGSDHLGFRERQGRSGVRSEGRGRGTGY